MSGRAYEHAAPTVVAVDAGVFDKTHINDMIGCRRVLGGTEDSREIVAKSSHNIDPSTGLLHGARTAVSAGYILTDGQTGTCVCLSIRQSVTRRSCSSGPL